MDEPENKYAIIDVVRGYFSGRKLGADVIKILGPAPNQPEAGQIYDQFRSGIIKGLTDAEFIRLIMRACRKELGEEGSRLIDRLSDTAKQNGLSEPSGQKSAPVPPAQTNKRPTRTEISAEMGRELSRVLNDHGTMRKNGTLRQYLLG
jgi:hypothetical protein